MPSYRFTCSCLILFFCRVRAAEQQLTAAEEQSPEQSLRQSEERLKVECTDLRAKIDVAENQLQVARQESERMSKVKSLQSGALDERVCLRQSNSL